MMILCFAGWNAIDNLDELGSIEGDFMYKNKGSKVDCWQELFKHECIYIEKTTQMQLPRQWRYYCRFWSDDLFNTYGDAQAADKI